MSTKANSAITRDSFPEQTGVDSLKFCADLWWWFHEMDAASGLRSSFGGQTDALELGTIAETPPSEPVVSLATAARSRKMHARLKRLSEAHYGTLRVWYTERRRRPSETLVAAAHQAFYATRGGK